MPSATMRSSVALAVLVSLMLSAGCGSDGQTAASAARPDRAGSRPSTASTSSGPPSTVAPELLAAGLPACDPGDESYTTVPDWVTGDLPGGTTMDVAGTSVLAGRATGQEIPTRYLLVESDHDRVRNWMYLERDGPPYERPGTALSPGERTVDTVRGGPGRIARWINRGDSYGSTVGEWNEGDHRWQATSQMSVDDLATALSSLDLGARSVGDPSGHFEVVGSGPDRGEGRTRVTDLEVSELDGAGRPVRRYFVRIDSPVPGVTGLTRLPGGAEQVVGESAGRLVVTSGSQVSSTTADGSQVGISTYAPRGVPVPADPATVSAILSSLRRRTPKDSSLLGGVPLAPPTAGADIAAELCRER